MNASETDAALSSAIEDLVARGVFGNGSPAYDIAQRVIANGYESLTRAQRRLYDSVVVPALNESKDSSQRPASIPIDKLNALNDE